MSVMYAEKDLLILVIEISTRKYITNKNHVNKSIHLNVKYAGIALLTNLIWWYILEDTQAKNHMSVMYVEKNLLMLVTEISTRKYITNKNYVK